MKDEKDKKHDKSDKCLHSHSWKHEGCEGFYGEVEGVEDRVKYEKDIKTPKKPKKPTKGSESDRCLHSHWHSGCEDEDEEFLLADE